MSRPDHGTDLALPATTPAPRARRWMWVLLGALILTGIASIGYVISDEAGPGFAARGVPLDDVWIHMVYGRSIAQGRPFQYNPGEWETGSTSPLWAILLAPAHLCGVSPVAVAKILGILLIAGAAAAGCWIAAQVRDPRAGIAFAAALPITPYFTFAAVSGTEVPLFLFLLFGTIGLALTERHRLTGLACGLAILARPEGYILLALLSVVLTIQVLRGRGSHEPGPAHLARRGADLLVPALAVVSPWIGYCLIATGRPLPSTFYVKAEWYGFLSLGHFRKIGALLLYQPFFGEGLGSGALGLIGAAISLLLIGFGLHRLSRAGLHALILVGLFGPLFLYTLTTTHPLGALKSPDLSGSTLNFYTARYVLPGIAPILLVWLLGLSHLERTILARRRCSRRALIARRIALTILFLALPAACTVHQHRILSRLYSWNCQNIEELQVAAAKWLAATIPTGTTIGVSDAGAMRYFGGHRIIDLGGLNTHALIPLLRRISRTQPGSAEEALLRAHFWSDRPPDYLAVTYGWHQPLLRDRNMKMLNELVLRRNTICGGPRLLILKPED